MAGDNSDVLVRLRLVGAQAFTKGTRQASSGMDRLAARSKNVSGGFRSGLGGAVAMTGGVYGLGRAVSFAASEYVESAKVGAQTAAVIKSTGGAARVTAKDVERLSARLSTQAGIDDEVIQSGANLLLTFKNVRNEAGKGNDIFNQTTAAAVDMGVALGTTPQRAAMQLGKALNDPVKGMTRLTRSGVDFTDSQKKQVEAMVRTGDTLGAQRIILSELNAQFGGSAAAQAQPIDRLRVAVGNFAETVATVAAPSVERFLGNAADFVSGMQEGTGAGGRFAAQARRIADELRPLVQQGVAVGKWLAAHPQLVLAAAGGWVAFRVIGRTVRLFKSVRGAAKATHTAIGWMSKTKAGSALVSRLAGPLSSLRGKMFKPIQGVRAPVVSSLGRTGTVAGKAAATNIAAGTAANLGPSVNAKKPGMRVSLTSLGKWMGRIVGAASATVIVLLAAKAWSNAMGEQGRLYDDAGVQENSSSATIGPSATGDVRRRAEERLRSQPGYVPDGSGADQGLRARARSTRAVAPRASTPLASMRPIVNVTVQPADVKIGERAVHQATARVERRVLETL